MLFIFLAFVLASCNEESKVTPDYPPNPSRYQPSTNISATQPNDDVRTSQTSSGKTHSKVLVGVDFSSWAKRDVRAPTSYNTSVALIEESVGSRKKYISIKFLNGVRDYHDASEMVYCLANSSGIIVKEVIPSYKIKPTINIQLTHNNNLLLDDLKFTVSLTKDGKAVELYSKSGKINWTPEKWYNLERIDPEKYAEFAYFPYLGVEDVDNQYGSNIEYSVSVISDNNEVFTSLLANIYENMPVSIGDSLDKNTILNEAIDKYVELISTVTFTTSNPMGILADSITMEGNKQEKKKELIEFFQGFSGTAKNITDKLWNKKKFKEVYGFATKPDQQYHVVGTITSEQGVVKKIEYDYP